MNEELDGYVTTAQPLVMSCWNGQKPIDKNILYKTIPKGTVLKIISISDLNDCGLVDNNDPCYSTRVSLNSNAITDIRRVSIPTEMPKLRLIEPNT